MGRKRADDRATINGILFILRSGGRWQDIPACYPSPATCWRRLRRWEEEGVWDRLWKAFLSELELEQKIHWAQAFLDGMFVPSKKRGTLGLSKKGKGVKVMLVTDACGLPLAPLVAPSNRAEVHLAEPTLARIWVKTGRKGRPRTCPASLVADKAYDSQFLRVHLQARGIRPCIPRKRNHRPRRGPKTNLSAYRDRWHIERTFAWLGSFRRLAVRSERLDSTFSGFLSLACSLLCLRALLK